MHRRHDAGLDRLDRHTLISMDHRTPLARARGLGSAHHGSSHWWRQRITALALLPLGIWFVLSLARLPHTDYLTVRHWFGNPVHTGLTLLFVVAALYHAALGLRVVLEDYVQTHGWRWSAIFLVQALLWLTGLAATLTLLHLLFSV